MTVRYFGSPCLLQTPATMYMFKLLIFVKDNESDEGWHRADENGVEDVELMMVTMMMTRIMMMRVMLS